METEYSKYEPIFGSWKINRLIGEGSYGKVYEIEREDFGVVYKSALKIITIPKSQSDVKNIMADGMDEKSASTYFRSFVEEMTKEFALMDKLKGNSYIVNYEDHTVIEHQDEIGWDVLIRMELLTPLNEYLSRHQITGRDVAALGIDLCKALEICDKFDIIHRDIKPENIFVSDLGNYKLGDFGIARVAEKTTGASTKIGTTSYMAPEIVRGENYTEQVDVYSLGLVLYRLLNNNRLPFLPPAPQPITYSQREEANAKRIQGLPLPTPAHADEAMARIVLKASAANVEDRYRNATQMRKDLEAYLGISETAEPEKKPVVSVVPNPAEEEATVPLRVIEEAPKPEPSDLTTVLPVTEEKPVSAPEKKKSKAALIIPLVAVFCFVVGVLLFFLFSNGSRKPEDPIPTNESDTQTEVLYDAEAGEDLSSYDRIVTITAVGANGARIYETTDENATIVARAKAGTQFGVTKVIQTIDKDPAHTWYEIRFAGGRNGYVNGTEAELTESNTETSEAETDEMVFVNMSDFNETKTFTAEEFENDLTRGALLFDSNIIYSGDAVNMYFTKTLDNPTDADLLKTEEIYAYSDNPEVVSFQYSKNLLGVILQAKNAGEATVYLTDGTYADKARIRVVDEKEFAGQSVTKATIDNTWKRLCDGDYSNRSDIVVYQGSNAAAMIDIVGFFESEGLTEAAEEFRQGRGTYYAYSDGAYMDLKGEITQEETPRLAVLVTDYSLMNWEGDLTVLLMDHESNKVYTRLRIPVTIDTISAKWISENRNYEILMYQNGKCVVYTDPNDDLGIYEHIYTGTYSSFGDEYRIDVEHYADFYGTLEGHFDGDALTFSNTASINQKDIPVFGEAFRPE